MDRRSAVVGLATLGPMLSARSSAQALRNARVAWVTFARAEPDSPFLQGFRGRLRELGWIEGRNLTLDIWGGDGTAVRMKELVAMVVASKPDVIVATGGPTARYFVDADVTPPIAFSNSADVVVAGLVQSYARPGVNRTGVSFYSLELVPKRMALMKECLPKMKQVAIVGWPPHAGEGMELDAAKVAAAKLGLQQRYYGAHNAAEVDAALEAIAQTRADAIMVFAGTVAAAHGDRFAAFSLRTRIPAVSAWAEFADSGNLMSYGPVLRESFVSLAGIVDRILNGAKAADIAVERPTRIEMVLNLKTAQALGLKLPQTTLLQADRLIE
jgi:putative tryptophan/tyrosine transport system substrate-binding protein